jgi:hypothetical protein
MSRRPPRILTQQRLLYCILVNQLATPGLGSLLARRFVSGTGQLLLALAGFSLSTVWMFQFSYSLVLEQWDQPGPSRAPDWMWTWGLVLLGTGWGWALLTSISLYREAQKMSLPGPTNLPPRISDTPGQQRGTPP